MIPRIRFHRADGKKSDQFDSFWDFADKLFKIVSWISLAALFQFLHQKTDIYALYIVKSTLICIIMVAVGWFFINRLHIVLLNPESSFGRNVNNLLSFVVVIFLMVVLVSYGGSIIDSVVTMIANKGPLAAKPEHSP